ncbi:MAG TPA: tetratricopeptide repeat protein, partial [Capsulimonadaceae bacterium]|nr:tetratricopeptide repeat protein [Capsulimonadaceae bacterium]
MKISPAILKATAFRPGQTSIFCTQCGTPNTRDSKFCKECGESLVTTYAPKISSDPFVQAGLGRDDQVQRLLDMAFWHNEAGNIGAALLACQAALALNDRSVTAWSLMGCLYEKKGDLDKAIEAFEVVTALNPDSMADAQKLEALRRGVHIKAVPQPATYRWVPPAMARYVQERPSAPAVGAAGATVAVLILGLLAMHPLFSADNRYRSQGDAPNLSATRSAWSSGNPGSVSTDISPMRTPGMQPQAMAANPYPQRHIANVISPSSSPGYRDPFAGTPPPPVVVAPPEAHPHKTDQADSSQALPPLSVKSLPNPGDIQPLPGAAPIPVRTSVASVPEHTVAVNSLTSDSSQQGASLPGEDGSP